MIEPTDADIGRSVLYTGNRYVGGKTERGVVQGFNHWTVFVRYGADVHAKGTNREDLEWETMRKPGQFRDETALEVLQQGESEAMAGLGGAALAMAQVAGTIDARFAAIEARLKALEGQLLRPSPANHGPFGPTWDTDRVPGYVSEELRQKLAREANEAVPGRTGVGGVVSTAAGEAHVEQFPQDRDHEGGAVETGGEIPLPAGGGTPSRRDDG